MKIRETILACALATTIAFVPLAGCASQSGDASSETDAESTAQTSADESADASSGDEQFVLYLGTNDKDTNEPVYSQEESMERAKAILMDSFGGYTIQEAEGGWRSDDGTEYQEYTLVIYLSDTDIDTVHAAASELVEEFHQSSVLINTERVETEFYAGE